MNYPSTPFLMLTVLHLASKGPTSLDGCLADVHAFVDKIQPMDPESLLPERMDSDTHLRERLHDAARHMEEAGLLTAGDDATYVTTERGSRLLEQNPHGIDDTVLEQFVEFRRFLAKYGKRIGPTEPTVDYRTGFGQYHDGCQLSDNPYDPETAHYQDWNAGWFEAFEEALDHNRDGQHFPHMSSS